VHSNISWSKCSLNWVSLWREMEEQIRRTFPDASGQPGSHAENEAVVVGVALFIVATHPSMASTSVDAIPN